MPCPYVSVAPYLIAGDPAYICENPSPGGGGFVPHASKVKSHCLATKGYESCGIYLRSRSLAPEVPPRPIRS